MATFPVDYAMKVTLTLLSCVLVLSNPFACPADTGPQTMQWAANIQVGDHWPGWQAEDQTGVRWSGPNGQATLYLFNRSVVW